MRNIALTCLTALSLQTAYASLPYTPIEFPRDEGAHYQNVPYNFASLIEWWYFNGALTSDAGKHLSYDVAFFNGAINSKNTIYTRPMLHIQVADLDQKQAYGIAIDYPLNVGKISTNDLDFTVNDDYRLNKINVNGKEVYQLLAQGKNGDTTIKVKLMLDPRSAPFLINENGLMPMPDDTNSYYYSIPHIATTGTIQINDTIHHIKATPGDSWMDHQWGDFNVHKNGWEWFSMRLENGLLANIFLNVNFKTGLVVGGLANIILPNGEKKFISYHDMSIKRDNYWYDAKYGISYPMAFHINIPSLGLELHNVAAFPEQELHSYWEGLCNVTALYKKQDLRGYSYTELVYQQPR